MVKSLRASYYLLGALLAGSVKLKYLSRDSCDFGFRPIDHTQRLRSLGRKIDMEGGILGLLQISL